MKKQSESLSKSDASTLVNVWQRANAELDIIRLKALREMTEQQSALIFSKISKNALASKLCVSSGLVEQQLAFDRLRKEPL
ncbi:MAG: hypothetical protein SH820_09795 [Xanthomonadales bacterium]|nr:hypothetical protein [Xanthomonadales bacterium]